MTTMTELAIRPFEVHFPDEPLDDLRRRIAATRWPSKELVADRSQGVQSVTIQALAKYWVTEYDWRRCEAKLNALPQFITEIDGQDAGAPRPALAPGPAGTAPSPGMPEASR